MARPDSQIGAAAHRLVWAFLFLALLAAVPSAARAQNKPQKTNPPSAEGPTDPKARKTFAEAQDWLRHGSRESAIDAYRKANKQDGGHCFECLQRAYNLAFGMGDFKTAAGVAGEWLLAAKDDTERANVHFELAVALQREGIAGKKEKCFNDSCDELRTALKLDPGFTAAHFALGVSLAELHQDDAARAEFNDFLNLDPAGSILHERAARYVQRVDLARARMAPPFEITTLDGEHISMDRLAGKVVLIDFWATWCGPCREALPHIRDIAREFQGQPLVVLSVSMDEDDAKWRDFVAKNGMTWLQVRDGRFTGPMATRFAVNAIPSTFSIDADGVLEDQHVGDASIEGKLKKMVAQAIEMQNSKPAPAAAAAGSVN
ncbi:MAG: redoxin domain-containing protein [Terracidiphilus sp.]